MITTVPFTLRSLCRLPPAYLIFSSICRYILPLHKHNLLKLNPLSNSSTPIQEYSYPAPLSCTSIRNLPTVSTHSHAFTMPKRSAPTSPIEDFASKKQKLDTGVSDAPVSPTPAIAGPQSHNVIPPAEDAPVDNVVDVAENADAGDNSEQSTGKKAKKPKQPPVHLAFDPWRPSVTVPPQNEFWGRKPRTGDARPHADQPSARDSNAATNPPLWEDRGYRFKRGSRYVKYFGPIKPEGADDGPDLDQEDLLVVKLIDMRPTSKHDRTPRRSPTYYFFEAGKPKDWNSMQAIKALNDRRHQAIDRITADAPWTLREREYLSALINERPDASIWELAELHNDYFMDREYADGTGFGFAELSTGRTVESVRYEYLTYKPAYDDGAAPQNVRWRKDKSAAGKALEASKRMEKAFGPPSRQLENEFDDAAGVGDDASDDEKPAKEATPKKAITKKAGPKKETLKKTATGKVTKKMSTKKSKKASELQVAAANAMAEQSKLADEDEELLNLAGLDAPEHIRSSSPLSLPPDSPLAAPSPPTYKPLSSGLNAPDYMRASYPHYLPGDSIASPPCAPSSISSLSDSPLSPVPEAHAVPPVTNARVPGTPEPRSPSPVASPILNLVPETRPSSPAPFSPLQELSPVPETRAPSPVATREPSPVPETRPASPFRADTPIIPPTIPSRSPSPIPAPLALVETQTEVTTAVIASEDDLTTQDELDALFGEEVVQETQVVETQVVPVPPAPRVQLRGMRDVVIDDNYDDDEDEEL
jgi:hypothetical protein